MIIGFFYIPFLILQCFVKAYDNLEGMPGLIEKNTGQDVRKKVNYKYFDNKI